MNGVVYIQDQIDLTDKLQIRLVYDGMTEQDLTNLRSSPAKTVTSSDSRVTPQLGAVYSLNDEFSVYASYGGHRVSRFRFSEANLILTNRV